MNDKTPETAVALKGQSLSANPFGNVDNAQKTEAPTGNAMMTAEMQRQVAEIQAQFMMALHRPRNPRLAVDAMLLECQRSSLAAVAIYNFARGGSSITGLSIRALEMVARNWCNIKYGFRVLERRKGSSLLQAYAYDLESNVPVERVFEVRHVRDKKGVQGGVPLTDERDIYEMEANQAQRRVRACIEALIPGDVQEAVEDAMRHTLKATADVTPEGIKKMLEAFQAFGVNQKMLEARIQRNLSAMDPAQWVGLRTVYNSLRDGMGSPEQFFDIALADSKGDDKPDAATSLKQKIIDAKGGEAPPAETKPEEGKEKKDDPKPEQKPEPEKEKKAEGEKTTETKQVIEEDQKIADMFPPDRPKKS